MIGFIATPEIAQAVNDAVASAQTSRSLPVYWLPGAYPIYSGPHTGLAFIPADDAILCTPLRGDPPMTPRDFPEFDQLVAALGGLDARIDIDPFIIATSVD
jgi:hypothetical protein